MFVIAIMSKRVAEAGALIGVVGGLIIAWGALSFLRAEARRGNQNRARERQATALGAALVALGFLVQLVALLVGK